MEDKTKRNITVTEMCPLLIAQEGTRMELGTVTLQAGGYIDITANCEISIDVLVKTGRMTAEKKPDIVVRGVHGQDGKPGENGSAGGQGATSEIRIEDLKNKIDVHVYGGGNGGDGGHGGNGGQGGDGAPGSCGGNGGDGGDGGNGCSGGDGGSGGHLQLAYGSLNKSEVNVLQLSASGGKRGCGGLGGKGGNGKCKGDPGAKGNDGQPGEDGLPGTCSVTELATIE